MSPAPDLAPPGSSSYTSDTMHVGDGTWDSSRDDFLLPNLVGLNFNTMRYNGMGNRFFTMNEYHTLIEAHGVIAGITFLGLVPAAIFIMRFYTRNPRVALRLHIWLQVLTLMLTTVVLMLGWFAVGHVRSLTNPHHGVGLAIYVLIWVQFFGGWLVHKSEKNRRHFTIPIKAILHGWLGRAIGLLGIVQVVLGLTLYGSPPLLFALYTLFTFALLVMYFVLELMRDRRRGDLNSQTSAYSGEVVEEVESEHRQSGLGKLAAAGIAGAGLWAWLSRRKKKPHSDVTGTDESGTSYLSAEKHSAASSSLIAPSHHGWGHRLLQIGAVAGAIAAVRSLFNRKGHADDSSDVGPYRPPLGGNQSVTTDTLSHIEEGRPPPNRPMTPIGASPGYVRPSHPLAAPPMTPGRRNSGSSYSYASYMSGSPSRRDRRPHTFRDALAVGGTVFAVRQLFKSRRQRKENRRAEELRKQRIESEQVDRMNSTPRYTGDGIAPPRRIRTSHMRSQSQSATDLSSSLLDDRSRRSGANTAVPVAAVGSAAAAALADRERIRPVGTDPIIAPPGPASAMVTDVPPVPPVHRTNIDSSGSEVYTTGSGRPRHRHHLRDEAAAGLAGAAIGAGAAEATRRRHSGRNTDSTTESPPVGLHVKMFRDGRVTLRRLAEEEAAAEREAGRRARRGSTSRRRRHSSLSSSSGGEALGAGSDADRRRWRRTEMLEAQQAAGSQVSRPATNLAPPPPSSAAYPAPPQAVDSHPGQAYNLPPPPPIPGSTSGLGGPTGSITSPGTETSVATDYANNRRRRRAERAQAKLNREGRTGGGNTVDFT